MVKVRAFTVFILMFYIYVLLCGYLKNVVPADIVNGRALQEAENGRRLVGIIHRKLHVQHQLILGGGGGHREDTLRGILRFHAQPLAVVEQGELVVQVHRLGVVKGGARVAARHVLRNVLYAGLWIRID
jgi:hypothetical protein